MWVSNDIRFIFPLIIGTFSKFIFHSHCVLLVSEGFVRLRVMGEWGVSRKESIDIFCQKWSYKVKNCIVNPSLEALVITQRHVPDSNIIYIIYNLWWICNSLFLILPNMKNLEQLQIWPPLSVKLRINWFHQ